MESSNAKICNSSCQKIKVEKKKLNGKELKQNKRKYEQCIHKYLRPHEQCRRCRLEMNIVWGQDTRARIEQRGDGQFTNGKTLFFG